MFELPDLTLSVPTTKIADFANSVDLDEVAHDLTLSEPVTKIVQFANSIDIDEVAHHEPPHLDLHFLPSNLWLFNMI